MSKLIKISELKELEVHLFGMPVDTNDTFSFKHIWDLIDSNQMALMFLTLYTRTTSINEFIEESKKEKNQNTVHDGYDGYDGMDKIELYYGIDIRKEETSCCWSIHGTGKEDYALELSPINNLNHFPVTFKNTFAISGLDKNKPYDETIIDVVPTPTLLDVLDCIIFEVSFFGAPSKRNKQFEKLKQRISEIGDNHGL